MTHEPLCPWANTPTHKYRTKCQRCDLIARVRADVDARWHSEMIEWRKEVEAVLRERLLTQVNALRVVESRVKGRRITVLLDRADVLALLGGPQ
jgi:hypothetical protein